MANEKVTDESTYLNRRAFMRAGVLTASVLATAALYRTLNPIRRKRPRTELADGVGPTTGPTTVPTTGPAGYPQVVTATHPDPNIASAFQSAHPRTPFDDITHYNNFYEFSTDKEAVADLSQSFKTRPWTIEVGGLVNKPTTFDLDDIYRIAPPEERVYRMRCVEAWSMIIPWAGYSLSKLLERVEPKSDTKFVAFQTIVDKRQMPGTRGSVLDWPYVEGLRMDEAMHPLSTLTTGLYGKPLPPQDGAPVRLVVPWKYGFKGIKSIVKITLVDKQPPTTWNVAAPREYGFYANVNPEVDHPRWTQATERRIGESDRRPTLMFNGYAQQVAHLYAGMDLRTNF